MKLLDYLLNGPDVEEKENFCTNIVTSVTPVPAAPEPKSVSKIEQPAAKPKPVSDRLQHRALGELPPGAPKGATNVTVLPHCPYCSSFYLYRRNNISSYECRTCGLTGIEEHVAKRVQ